VKFAPIFVTALGLALAASASAGPSIVFDPKTGEVLGAERAGEPWYPASLTKLMTAYVVFQRLRQGRLKLDQQIPVSAFAAGQPPSKIGVPAGKTVTVDFALQALLVFSANDMAYVLAEAAGGSVPAFVNEMNANAERLGLTGSYFTNPNGWFDERQVTTARDIGVLAARLLDEFPQHSHYYAQDVLQVGERKLRNRNSLIRRMQGADGMKTGFICNSGYNLVASATLEGRKLVAVVLGAANGSARINEAEELLAQGFAKPRELKALRIGEIGNFELGALVPADLTAQVCRSKPEAPLARARDLGGWGISLGRYASALDANKALRARMLGARHILTGGESGVVQIPGAQGFNAMIWRLAEKSSIDVCVHFAKQKVPCDVLPPESFARIAALAPDEPKPKLIEQGGEEDDDGADATPVKKPKPKAKVKARKKRVKAKVR
jgi:D-alanyl-D-alanine carboxypeptidase